MNILVASADYFKDEIVARLLGNVTKKKYSRQELLQEIAGYDIILTRVDNTFDRQILEQATRLKIIGTATIGLDHIDMEFARLRGIEIINIAANALPTAEYTFSLIMAAAKKIPWSYASLSRGEWNRAAYFGTELKGKTLGIVGFGRIGQLVATYAQAFGMKIIAYDPYINAEAAHKTGVLMCSLDQLLQESDIVTLHVFLSPETKKMINAQALAIMKPSAILINASRGEVVDEEALVRALQMKMLKAAALDVFCDEPLPIDSRLVAYARANQNLLLTPHLAASSTESVDASAAEVVEKVKQRLAEMASKSL